MPLLAAESEEHPTRFLYACENRVMFSKTIGFRLHHQPISKNIFGLIVLVSANTSNLHHAAMQARVI
jgi:hypothetical protein